MQSDMVLIKGSKYPIFKATNIQNVIKVFSPVIVVKTHFCC